MKKSIVYTRTGDDGTTSLVDGTRAAKDSTRLEAYGTVDELNAHIGIVAAQTTDTEVNRTLTWVQHRLFDIGGYLACDPNGAIVLPPGVDSEAIARLESAIDVIDNQLPRIKEFVLPSGTIQSAQTHVARTVCRRAERRIVALAAQAPVDNDIVKFINRLSDYLFVLARFNNISRGVDEIFWQKDC